MSKTGYAMKMIKHYRQIAKVRLTELNIDPDTEHELTRARWGNEQKPQIDEERYRELLEARALRKLLQAADNCIAPIKYNDIDKFAFTFQQLTDARIEAGVNPFLTDFIPDYDSHKGGKGGKNKKDYKNPFTQKLAKICESFDVRPSLDQIINKLESMAKDYENYDPVIIDINREKEEVTYQDANRKEKTIKFSTLDNKLSEIFNKP